MFGRYPLLLLMAKVRQAFASRNQRCAPTVAQSLTQKNTSKF